MATVDFQRRFDPFQEVDTDVKRREMDALVRASEQLSCKSLVLINDEEEGDETVHQNGLSRKVTIIPMWKWLLTPPPRPQLS